MDNRQDNISSIDDLRLEHKLLDGLKALDSGLQKAILWYIYHIDFLDLIDSGRIMTEEEERAWMERAKRDDAYILMVLIQYKKVKDQARRNGTL